MRFKLVYLLILVFFLTSSCQEEKNGLFNYRDLDFGELFTYYLTIPDSVDDKSIIKVLDDSILSHSNKFIFSFEKTDKNREYLSLQFRFSGEDLLDDLSIKKRNQYKIQLDRDNNIIANRELVENLDSLTSDMKEFIMNPENKEYLPEKKFKVINLLDTVLVCNQGFHILASMVKDSMGQGTSWRQLKMVINKVTNTYYSLRSSSSIGIWNEKFDSLDLEKQIALSELIPIQIWLFPNRDYKSFPPPPEIKNLRVFEILLTEDEESEILDEKE